ncbi:efflux RND transporter periplasmic adaptor subunit [Metaclostridioides mangenotii]|uniref:HlyD family secretion protein n=2 Tax=Metaclostridioides mangenotii TaxID=1540 RepID=A0ABS4EBA8_9FIRM|nr:efflux RND transporter periplasmic adaptor subunit [Clostridioides mangenotii]MBP1855228.1 HlyD family secretion protein [Clostridioides mangenotii]
MKLKNMKRMTKKKKIYLSIVAGVVALLAIIISAVYVNLKKGNNDNAYTSYKIEKPEPLLFKGFVTAEKVYSVFYDQSLGKVTDILVKDGQEIKSGDAILSYKNEEIQSEADAQENSLKKLSISVDSAKNNLNNARSKVKDYKNKLSQSKNELGNIDASTSEGQQKKQELKAAINQYEEQLDAQNSVVTQSESALSSAKLDYKDASKSVDSIRKKANKNVTAEISGIVSVNEKGKTDPTVPVIKIISKNVVVEGIISEYDYDSIKLRQRVKVRPVSQKEEIGGQIKQINQLPDTEINVGDNQANSTGSLSNYKFLVELDSPVQYGYSVQIKLPIDELRIPKKALIKEGNKEYVYLYISGKVIKKPIKTETKNEVIVVLEGIKEGDVIISNPDKELKDGDKIELKSDNSAVKSND